MSFNCAFKIIYTHTDMSQSENEMNMSEPEQHIQPLQAVEMSTSPDTKAKSGFRKDKGIDYLFLFISVRVFHTALYVFKSVLQLCVTNRLSDLIFGSVVHVLKRLLLDVMPATRTAGIVERIERMSTSEFCAFLCALLDTFEEDMLRNKSVDEQYRQFLGDVTRFYVWSKRPASDTADASAGASEPNETEMGYVTQRYTFERDLHYMRDVLKRLHVGVSDESFSQTFHKVLRYFDVMTENVESITVRRVQMGVSDGMYAVLERVQSAFGF